MHPTINSTGDLVRTFTTAAPTLVGPPSTSIDAQNNAYVLMAACTSSVLFGYTTMDYNHSYQYSASAASPDGTV